MNQSCHIYRTTVLPDRTSALDQLAAGGDVLEAVGAGFTHISRMVANCPEKSVSVAIRLCYDPAAGRKDPQDRLSIFMAGQAHDEKMRVPLDVLLRQSPLHAYYRSKPVAALPADGESFAACCDVVRQQGLLDSTVPPDQNPNVPPSYYQFGLFEARDDNDRLADDALLHLIDEPVRIEICIEPADMKPYLQRLTRYASLLNAVTRSWEHDEDPVPPDWVSRDHTRLTSLHKSDPLADEVRHAMPPIRNILMEAHVRFHLRVYARTTAVARLVASIVAEGAFKNGNYQLLDHAHGHPFFEQAVQADGIRVLPAPTTAITSDERVIDLYKELAGLQSLATVSELAGAWRLPVASHASPRCISKSTDPPFVDPRELIVLGYDDPFAGEADGPGIARGVPITSLQKHMLITATPGKGKTSACLRIVIQLHEHGIPVIVWEPTKTDYRALKKLRHHANPRLRRLGEAVRIYTPANEAISPVRANPLRHPKGITLYERIENLLSCFRAAMPLAGPLHGILGEALELVFKEHPDPKQPATMVDLCEAALRVLASKGYCDEVHSNFKAALQVRLGNLTRRGIGSIFRSRVDAPTIEDLTSGVSIMELKALPQEPACLYTLFTLMDIWEWAKYTPYSGEKPRLVLVIEEAHTLVSPKRNTPPSEDYADPAAFASELICRMMAELRSLGIGLIIANQLPSGVDPEVVKNTATKLALGQNDSDERELIGGAMLFGNIEMQEIVRFVPGHAYLITEGYAGPRRIRTPDVMADLDLKTVLFDEAILPYIQDEPWFRQMAAARASCDLDHLKEAMDAFDKARAGVMTDQTKTLALRLNTVLDATPSPQRTVQLQKVMQQITAMRDRLNSEFATLKTDLYQPVLERVRLVAANPGLQGMRAVIERVFVSTIESGVKAHDQMLGNLLARCQGISNSPTELSGARS